jgi:hypothetical protein
MKVFQTNFLHLVVLLIPTMLRKPVMIAMMRVFMKPVMLLQNWFNEQRKANLYDLAHTGQVCHIKAVLNDRFGLDYSNGFEIEDAFNNRGWLMIHDEGRIRDEGSEPDVIVDDKQVYSVMNGEATASKDLAVTGDEPGEVNKILTVSHLLWNEEMVFPDSRSFTVFVPGKIFDSKFLQMPLVRTLVNKYRIASRLPEYERKT